MDLRKRKHLPVKQFDSSGQASCGDAYAALAGKNPHQYDAIVTDPPYEIHIAGKDWDSRELHIDWLAYQFHRVLKPTGNIFIFCSDFQFGIWFRELSKYYTHLRKYAWIRTNPLMRTRSKFVEGFDLAIHACNGDAYFDKSCFYKNYNITATCSGKERIMPDLDEDRGRVKGTKALHPTQKPEAVICEILKALTREGDLIFDPFAGTGTLKRAALKLNRQYEMVEYNFRYFFESTREKRGSTYKP